MQRTNEQWQHVQRLPRPVRQTQRTWHDAQPDVYLRRIRPREQRGAHSMDGVFRRMAQQPAQWTWRHEEVPRRASSHI